jgi:hypothetical protein
LSSASVRSGPSSSVPAAAVVDGGRVPDAVVSAASGTTVVGVVDVVEVVDAAEVDVVSVDSVDSMLDATAGSVAGGDGR